MRQIERLLIIVICLVSAFTAPAISGKSDDDDFLQRLEAGPENAPKVMEPVRGKAKTKGSSERDVEERRSRSGIVAKSKAAALVTEEVVQSAVTVSPAGSKDQDGHDASTLQSSGSIEYYDGNGTLKWRKKLSPRKTAMHPRRISDGGEVVSIIEGCEMNCKDIPAGQPKRQLVVWDSTGNEMIRFPENKDACKVSSSGHWISERGDYVLIACLGTGKRKLPKSVFIDTRRKKIWRSAALLDVIVSQTRSPNKVLVQVTEDSLATSTKELELEKLTWEYLGRH